MKHSIATILCSAALLCTNVAHATVFGSNLIVNPGAEADLGAGDFSSSVAPSGWTTTSTFTAIQYAAGGNAELNPTSSAALGGGENYFAGGPGNASSTASQRIAVGDIAAQIDAGMVRGALSAQLGGFGPQTDSMTVTALFLDGSNAQLGTLLIGPVTNADRNNVSTLLSRDTSGAIPVGTRAIEVLMTATRAPLGSYNDGYADNLSLTLTAVPEADSAAFIAGGLALASLAVRRRRR
jgi:hypothetical protein